jgi:hexosaminidase
MTQWKKCPTCQKAIKDKGLNNEKELLEDFIIDIVSSLHMKGIQVIAWNDILGDMELPYNLTIQHWLGYKKSKALLDKGQTMIISDVAYHYFDYPLVSTSLKKTYEYNCPENAYGMEACLWTEHVPDVTTLYKAILPRLYAAADVSWNPNKDYEDFKKRLSKYCTYKDAFDPKGLGAVIAKYKHLLTMVTWNDIKNLVRIKNV